MSSFLAERQAKAFRVLSWAWFARRAIFRHYRWWEGGPRVVALIGVDAVRERHFCRALLTPIRHARVIEEAARG